MRSSGSLNIALGYGDRAREATSFLRTLDSWLRFELKHPSVDGLGHVKLVREDHYFEDRKLTSRQMRGISSLAGNGFILYPITTSMGFRVGFEVDKVDMPEFGFEDLKPRAVPLLKFVEAQLPTRYSFGDVAGYFMGERNLRLIDLCGLKRPADDRNKYDFTKGFGSVRVA